MEKLLVIPTVDVDGNDLSDEEAYKRYLSGEIVPIGEYDSPTEINGFKAYEDDIEWAEKVAWPWETQFPQPTPDPYDN